MFISGIADEAGLDITTQIGAQKELGLHYIELRRAVCPSDGKPQSVCTMSDKDFEYVAGEIERSGLIVSCIGSPIGDWSKSIRTNFVEECNLLRRTAKRMKELGCDLVRVMSYTNCGKNPLPEPEWRIRSITRMKGLLKIAHQYGITLGHENCSGWGGVSSRNNADILHEIRDPQFVEIFDTGNPPSYGADSWDWYMAVRPRIKHVHIKDARMMRPGKEEEYTMPGEGDGSVEYIVRELLELGYDGGFSIEPHLEAVIHRGDGNPDPEKLYQSYIAYGKAFAKLLKKCQGPAPKNRGPDD